MSDQAAKFTGQVISELCDLLGITKIRTSPYHPQTNGTVERVHQTLRRMIAKMDPDKRAKWPLHLGPILIAYNATRSLITGYSPYFLMFGHRPRLPVDLLFPTVRRDENSRTTDEYVTSLYDKLKSIGIGKGHHYFGGPEAEAALRPQGRGSRTTSGR